MADYPLEGIKVLDFSRVLAGPFATRMLSDLGADVIKVEPPEGDVTRFLGKTDGGVSGYYLQQNIGKRNICVDLKADGARALILELSKQCDFVVENFRPGVMARFGLGWEDLHAANPRLIMLSISGFGQEGPEKNRAAYAPVLHAETGLLHRQAEIGGGPTADMQYSMADTYSGLHGLVSLFAALRVAERTGKGQHIDIAMLNVMHATDDYAHWALDDVWPKPEEHEVWDTPGGQQIIITASLKWMWITFSKQDGLVDPTPKGADIATKIQLRRETMAKHMLSFPTFDALTQRLDEVNLAWGVIRAFGADSFAQPSIEERGVFVDVKDDIGDARRTTQSPYRFSYSASGITPQSRTPKRGEHNVEALQEWLDMPEDAIEQLLHSGVLHSEDTD